jgi:hypothetical protein
MSKKCTRQRLWLLALYAGGVVVATLQRGVWSREHTTFSIFRQSFTHLVQHQNLYAAYPAEQGAAAADLFKYSPSAAMLFAPLAMLPFPLALLAWNVLNAGLLFFLLTRLLPPTRANLALLLLAPEVFVAIQSSSSNALVTALILLAAVAYEEGRLLRGGYSLMVAASIKIFPLAGVLLAALQRRRLRAAMAAVVALLVVLALPLLVVPPRELLQQYRWWVALERRDANDLLFGLSVMRHLRDWLEIEWPNWTLQAVGTAIFLLPIALRRDRWSVPAFRMELLCSLLIYVVLFNHQAERQSFVIAATGAVIWFATGPRTIERGVLVALALLGVPTIPYLALWLVMQVELLRGAPAVVRVLHLAREGGARETFLRRWTGSWKIAS